MFIRTDNQLKLFAWCWLYSRLFVTMNENKRNIKITKVVGKRPTFRSMRGTWCRDDMLIVDCGLRVFRCMRSAERWVLWLFVRVIRITLNAINWKVTWQEGRWLIGLHDGRCAVLTSGASVVSMLHVMRYKWYCTNRPTWSNVLK